MNVKWDDLGAILVTSAGVTVVVVVMFSLGVAAWARAGDGPRPWAPRTRPQKTAAGVAALCFAVCLGVAAYGIDVIVPG